MGEIYAEGAIETPIGALRAAVTQQGVAVLAFPRSAGVGFRGQVERSLRGAERVPRLPLLDALARELEAYFEGRLRRFAVPTDLRGTEFQRGVWRALERIPYGETLSYAEVARLVQHPRAARAVGAASGANPVPILVPCHRVIATSGKLGGYGGGLDVKRRLLALERSRGLGDAP